MPRATIVLILVIVLLLAGLAWLSRRPADVPLHRIEQTVTAAGNGTDAGDGAQH